MIPTEIIDDMDAQEILDIIFQELEYKYRKKEWEEKLIWEIKKKREKLREN